MHIHSATSGQGIILVPTQSAQQASKARKSAAEVRRKLTRFAATGNADAVSHVNAYEPSDHGHGQNQQQEEESFRDIFVSIQV
jgi:hypothetical protein